MDIPNFPFSTNVEIEQFDKKDTELEDLKEKIIQLKCKLQKSEEHVSKHKQEISLQTKPLMQKDQ